MTGGASRGAAAERWGMRAMALFFLAMCAGGAALYQCRATRARDDARQAAGGLSNLASLAPGDPLRYEGRLVSSEPPVTSPVSGRRCVAYRALVYALLGANRETGAKERRNLLRKVDGGGAELAVRGVDGEVRAPRAAWQESDRDWEETRTTAPDFLPPMSLSRHPDFVAYWLIEECLTVGELIFVEGRVDHVVRAAQAEAGTGGAGSSIAVVAVRGPLDLVPGGRPRMEANLQGWALWYQLVAVGCLLLGAVLLGVWIHLERKRRRAG